jgi:tetratricopeptide (TPR) repeat protein
VTNRAQRLWVPCLLLVALTLFAFWPVLGNGFVEIDDTDYVTENARVQQGLTPSGLVWAWTTVHSANWHPLTWMSHMLDWELHGPDPLGHHLTSLLFHVASAVVLFLALERATGCLSRSAVVAALFAVHPLHVESVAWVAERKDVLSTFFWMLATWAYVRFAEAPGAGRYLLVLAAFAVGLTAKPMLVTLPFTFLLLDLWPLSRWKPGAGNGGGGPIPWLLLREKIPLLALSIASSAVTVLAQRSGRAVATLDAYPFSNRLGNAVVSYAAYLWKTLWPSDLSFFYLHPKQGLAPWQIGLSALALVSVTFLALRARSRRPYLLVGWLWYVGTLVPVIGLVQVGSQAMANRYTYVPLVGLFLMAAWGVPDLVESWQRRRASGAETPRWLALPAVALLLALAVDTRAETRYWRDSASLFERALAVSPDNYLAHFGLGLTLSHQGKVDEAIGQYQTTLRLRPDDARTHTNLALLLTGQGKLEEAHAHAQEAVRLYPGYADAHSNLGVVLAAQGRTEEAIQEYQAALALEPDDPQVHNNLGSALAKLGRTDEAILEFRSAVRARPDYELARRNLTRALFATDRFADAWKEIQESRRLGLSVPPDLLRDLSARMPEPRVP